MAQVDRLVLVMLAASLAANAVLGFQHYKLKADVRLRAGSARLHPGAKVRGLECRTDGGAVISLGTEAGKPVVVYGMSSTCRWCSANAARVQALASELKDTHGFVALCLDGDLDACRPLAPGIRACEPTPATRSQLRLGTVPQTVALSENGDVLGVWNGVYADETATEVASFFGLDPRVLKCPLGTYEGCTS